MKKAETVSYESVNWGMKQGLSVSKLKVSCIFEPVVIEDLFHKFAERKKIYKITYTVKKNKIDAKIKISTRKDAEE